MRLYFNILTTKGEEIKTDYSYVCDFFNGVEEALLKRNK